MKIKALEDTNASLIDENRCLKAELQNASNSLKLMKQELNNSQQYSRRDCLEIKGIPIQRNEVTNEVVKSVGNLIGVEVKHEDISISHRLAAKQNSQMGVSKIDPAIIVKFVCRDVRGQFDAGRKHLRGKSTRDIGLSRITEHKIYIGESLTQQNRQLFNSCLEKKQLNYKFIWTSTGCIFLRKDENSPISILEMKDLDKIH